MKIRCKRTQSPNKDFINRIENDLLHGNEKGLKGMEDHHHKTRG